MVRAYLIGIGPFAPEPFPSVTGGTLVLVLRLFGPGSDPYAMVTAWYSFSVAECVGSHFGGRSDAMYLSSNASSDRSGVLSLMNGNEKTGRKTTTEEEVTLKSDAKTS